MAIVRESVLASSAAVPNEVMPLPSCAASTLPRLKTRSTLSVVPKKLVPGVVPALPARPQLVPAAATALVTTGRQAPSV